MEHFLSVSGYAEMLSGLKSKYDERHIRRLYDTVNEHGGTISEIEIQCFNINNLLEKHGFTEVDFISLDTEGNELEVLQALNFDKIHIRALTVENNFHSDDLNHLLGGKGFERIKSLDADEVYVNRKDFNFLERLLIRKFSR
jgi:hypothetical protein